MISNSPKARRSAFRHRNAKVELFGHLVRRLRRLGESLETAYPMQRPSQRPASQSMLRCLLLPFVNNSSTQILQRSAQGNSQDAKVLRTSLIRLQPPRVCPFMSIPRLSPTHGAAPGSLSHPTTLPRQIIRSPKTYSRVFQLSVFVDAPFL